MQDDEKQFRGFAYVRFTNEEEGGKAERVAREGVTVDGRELRFDWWRDREKEKEERERALREREREREKERERVRKEREREEWEKEMDKLEKEAREKGKGGEGRGRGRGRGRRRGRGIWGRALETEENSMQGWKVQCQVHGEI
jgi:RNA recognition motif-containing protein